MEVLRGF